jgi:tetratricopeptide (TPR) repeat protein
VLDYEADGKVDPAIASLEGVVLASQYHSVEALVGLARLEQVRDSVQSRESKICQRPSGRILAVYDDFGCARLNLLRALAVDGASVTARNQLALWYVKDAERSKRPSALDTAAAICDDAIAIDPRYAPVRNTLGLARLAAGRHADAIAAFDAARALDPSFFDAHFNFASASLAVRDATHAEEGFRRAIALRPRDYESHLGLAVALHDRGAPNDAVLAELSQCRAIDASRPEADFNEGIFALAHATEADAPRVIQLLSSAIAKCKSGDRDLVALANDAISDAKALIVERVPPHP